MGYISKSSGRFTKNVNNLFSIICSFLSSFLKHLPVKLHGYIIHLPAQFSLTMGTWDVNLWCHHFILLSWNSSATVGDCWKLPIVTILLQLHLIDLSSHYLRSRSTVIQTMVTTALRNLQQKGFRHWKWKICQNSFSNKICIW